MGASSFPSSAIVNVTGERALARLSSGSGAVEEVTLTALMTAILDEIPTSDPLTEGQPYIDDTGRLAISYGSAPTITNQPEDTSALIGATATLSIAATSASSYQWQLDSGSGFANIAGATASSYTTPVLADGDDGNLYRCIVTNGAGATTSDSATLTVGLAPESATNAQYVLLADNGMYTDEAGSTAVSSESDTLRRWEPVVGSDIPTTDSSALSPVNIDNIGGVLVPRATSTSQGLRCNLASTINMTDFSIHLAVQDSGTAYGLLFGLGLKSNGGITPAAFPRWTQDGPELQINGTNITYGPGTLEGDSWRLISFVRSGSSWKTYVDGRLAKAVTSGTTTLAMDGVSLWFNASATGNGLAIGGACVANSAHTDAEVQRLFAWFANQDYWTTDNQVVWLGDSISTSLYTGQSNGIAAECLRNTAQYDSVLNLSIGGYTLQDWLDTYEARVLPHLSSSSVVVVFAGTNDLHAGETDSTAFARLTTLCNAIKPYCKKIAVATVLPRGPFDATKESYRQALNASIIAGDSAYDYVIDPTADSKFDEQSDSSDATNYSGDTVHLNAVGIDAIEPYFNTQIEAAVNS